MIYGIKILNTVVFCHGMPGSAADAELLRQTNPDAKIIALPLLDAVSENLDLGMQNAFDAALDQAGESQVHLVGFSIGTMVAIKLAAMRPESVSQLSLISAAAPLSLGNFLPKMAGKPVFDLAMKHPKLLRLLTWFQGAIVRVSPNTLIKMLFANSGPREKELLTDPSFTEILIQGLSASLVRRSASYIAYVSAYVTDWSDTLHRVKSPVTLWHGTKDTWSPPEMAEELERVFGQKTTVNQVEDAEHYSTLKAALL